MGEGIYWGVVSVTRRLLPEKDRKYFLETW